MPQSSQRLQAQLRGALRAHDQHRCATIVDARGIVRRHGAFLVERRLQATQRVRRRAELDEFIANAIGSPLR